MSSTAEERLLDSAVLVIGKEGISGLSVRSLARHAEVSPAQVQYYFRTKADLVARAFDRAGEQFMAMITPLFDQEPSLARLRAVLDQWLPLDTQRAYRARVWIAFADASAGDPDLAAKTREVDRSIRTWLVEELELLQHKGEVRGEIELAHAASALLALVDGLTVQALSQPVRHRRAFVSAPLDLLIGALAMP